MTGIVIVLQLFSFDTSETSNARRVDSLDSPLTVSYLRLKQHVHKVLNKRALLYFFL